MIVYINARFLTQQITGVQQFAFEICRYLQCSDIDFVLLVPGGCVVPQALSHLPHKVVGKNGGYIWEQVELPSFLKKMGSPLLINFCNTAPLLYSNQWITIHDLAFMHHPEWFAKSFARVYRFLIPRIAKRSKKLFTVSETIKKQLHKLLNIPIQKIEILHNGIHHELLQVANNVNAARKKYILTVSSINPRKNLQTLILAFSQADLNDYELMVVGAKNAVFGNTRLDVPKNVVFTGYLSNAELIKLYQESSLFVSLSYDEGFGIPALEALYCGCPVLLSDIPVYRECFGEVASFTSPFNVQQAASDMRKVIEQPTVAVVIEQLIKTYNYADSAKKLIKLLRETHEKM